MRKDFVGNLRLTEVACLEFVQTNPPLHRKLLFAQQFCFFDHQINLIFEISRFDFLNQAFQDFDTLNTDIDRIKILTVNFILQALC